MADGEVRFRTKLDNANLEKDLADAKKKIDKAMEDIQKYKNAKLPLTKQVEEYEKQLDDAKEKLDELKKRQESTPSISKEEAEQYKKATQELIKYTEKQKEAAETVENASLEADTKNANYKKAEQELQEMKSRSKEIRDIMEGNKTGGVDPNEFIRLQEEQEQLTKKIADQKEAVKSLRKEWEKAAKAVDVAVEKESAAESKAISAAKIVGSHPGLASEYEDQRKMESDIEKQEKAVAKLQKKWEDAQASVADYDKKISDANSTVEAQTAKAQELVKEMNSFGYKASQAMEKAKASAEKFGKKLLSISASVLVFNAIRSGMRAVVDYTKKLLSTNDEYKAQLAQLKGALMTAFQPIYNYVLPGVIAVLKVLTAIVSVVAKVMSSLFGTTVQDSAKAAESLNKEADAIGGVGSAAEEAQKQLMDFDEINRLQETETSTSGGGSGGSSATGITPDFSLFDTEAYKAKIDELTVYLSGALLALGAILAFSGANIPLGIALMAFGAAGLVTEIAENWDNMDTEVGKAINTVLGTLMLAGLVIGAILTFSGANLPLGIALMGLGAASLVTAAVLNWDAIKNALQGPIGEVVTAVSGVLLAVGILLAFSGMNIPLGIALIAAGAVGLVTVTAINWNSLVTALRGPLGRIVEIVSAGLIAVGALLAFTGINIPLGIAMLAAGAVGLVTVTALNWNAIVDNLKSVWQSITNWFNTNVKPKLTLAYWQEKFSVLSDAIGNVASAIWEAILDVWDKITGFFSWFTDTWNGIFGGGSSVGATDSSSSAGRSVAYSMPQTQIPVPALAKGAVLPANKPFLAMVGDQKNGTNVEAPLATIKQAMAEVLAQNGGGEFHVTVSFEGTEAQLIRYLSPKITVQQRKEARAKGG